MNQPPTHAVAPRRVRADGQRSRDAILDTAARLATVEGLMGLSIGNLAKHTAMSKSGLYAHFASKEALQLATIDRAVEIFDAEVVAPAHRHGQGLPLLWALCDEFLGHLERGVFPGGCFFASLSSELDTHPGPVKERLTEALQEWMGELVAAARQAVERGELDQATDAEQIGFELDAMLFMGHGAYIMYGDSAMLVRARRGIERLLGPRPRGGISSPEVVSSVASW
jgi:AcrR family transcriptional regulator